MKATVLALALMCAGAAFAQTPAAAPAHESHLDKLATLLDLTETQKLQVQQVLQDEHAKVKAAHEQAQSSDAKPDWQQMKAMHEQIAKETLTKLKPVLSPDQLKKFQTLQEMHGEMMHRHFGHGGPPSGSAPPSQN
ncbi:MAG TPA: hypothetical protein VEY89_11490 [Candidatus Dormibacteraeota bacterium]|nr:hypothetical protein [Candidatus Dormibacteraeota bacterium]